jgi:hypothetical protein
MTDRIDQAGPTSLVTLVPVLRESAFATPQPVTCATPIGTPTFAGQTLRLLAVELLVTARFHPAARHNSSDTTASWTRIVSGWRRGSGSCLGEPAVHSLAA